MNNNLNDLSLSNTLMRPKPERSSHDVTIYNQIFDAILSQRLLPGTKLTEEELAKIFKVSRTIVRRALLRLSQDCIVDIKPNRGASVACPTVKQAREIIQARRIIEAEIIREVVTLIDQDQIYALRQLVDEEKKNVEHHIRSSGIRLSGDFHLELAKVSKNTTLTKFIRELIPQTSLVIARYEKPGYATCSHAEHYELIDIIAQGDAQSAVLLMDKHLLRIEEKLDLSEHNVQVDLKTLFCEVG
jgi:DNA-binding GntR family transcriptional regulator